MCFAHTVTALWSIKKHLAFNYKCIVECFFFFCLVLHTHKSLICWCLTSDVLFLLQMWTGLLFRTLMCQDADCICWMWPGMMKVTWGKACISWDLATEDMADGPNARSQKEGNRSMDTLQRLMAFTGNIFYICCKKQNGEVCGHSGATPLSVFTKPINVTVA